MRARELFENYSFDLKYPVCQEMKEINDYAHNLGVVFDIELCCYDPPSGLQLQSLYRQNAPKGSGALIMDRLMAFADKWNLETTLDAESGSEGLFEYYGRWGFELEQHVIDDMQEEGEDNYAGPWIMYRLPR